MVHERPAYRKANGHFQPNLNKETTNVVLFQRPIGRVDSILVFLFIILLIGWSGFKQRSRTENIYKSHSRVVAISKNASAFQKITLGVPISINRASEEDLQAIPGIGSALARNIVLKRQQMGGFTQISQLLTVPGIGQGLFDKIRGYVTAQGPLTEKE